MRHEPIFENREVARLVNVNARTLIDWASRKLVEPDFRDAEGTGTRRAYSETNLVEIAVVKSLLADGIKRGIVKSLIDYGRKPLPGSDAPARERWFSLSEEWRGEGFILIDLATESWEHWTLGRNEDGKLSEKNLRKLGDLVHGKKRAYLLNLSQLKSDLRQKLGH